MSQKLSTDFNINPSTTSGDDLAAILNRLNDALDSSNTGSSEPSYKKRGTLWLDESNTANHEVSLKIYDGAHWIILATIDTTTGTVTASNYVKKTGDTLTGALKGTAPVDPEDLTRKDYVDSMVRHKNILINGGFDVWQRGIDFQNLTVAAYTADRWWSYTGPGHTRRILRQSVNTVGNYDLRWSDCDLYFDLRQGIEIFNGKRVTKSGKLTLSFHASFPTGSDVKVLISYADNMSIGNPVVLFTGKVGDGIGAYDKYSISMDDKDPLPANTLLCVRIHGGAGNSSHYLANVQLEEGSVATEFERLPLSLTEMLCYRYTQKLSSASVPEIDLRPQMRATPTITAFTGGHLYEAEL